MSSTMNISLPYNGLQGVHDTVTRTPHSGFDTTTSYEQSRRQVSSVVVSEQFLGDVPESGTIKYVEVPIIEEVIKHVPRREVIEREKIVPVYEYEYVDRVVEIPQVHYVDRQVEKEQIVDVVRHVPVKRVQEVPREVVVTVPKVEYVQVEKVVEVPGQVIEVPKPYTVENKVAVKRWVDKNTPVVVAQTIRPVISESSEIIDVDVYEYEPQVIPIDVHVAKPVASQLVAVGATQEMHQLVTVPAAQYNSLLRSLNAHLGADVDQLPYLHDGQTIPFLAQNEIPGTAVPAGRVAIHNAGTVESLTRNFPQEGMTTTSSVYQQHQGHHLTTQTSSVMGRGVSVRSTSQIPPVYSTITGREGESEAKFPSQSPHKQKSRPSIVHSHPAQQKCRGCRC